MSDTTLSTLFGLVDYYVGQILEMGIANSREEAEKVLIRSLACNTVDAEIIDTCRAIAGN